MNKWIELLKNNDFFGVNKYIKDGADINEANESGESVLASSLRYRCDLDLVMLLIESGADIYDFAYHPIPRPEQVWGTGRLERHEYIL